MLISNGCSLLERCQAHERPPESCERNMLSVVFPLCNDLSSTSRVYRIVESCKKGKGKQCNNQSEFQINCVEQQHW